MATKSFTRKIVINDRTAITKLNTPKEVKSDSVRAIFSDLSKNKKSNISEDKIKDILTKF